jgi:flavin-dependent dehydrogenase
MALGLSLDGHVNQMKTDFLIIGGGVAGLSAAIHLAERGADVALLEEGRYPVQKICGEFLSPEAIPLLEQWDIQPSSRMHHLTIQTSQDEWSMAFPEQTATIMRYTLDAALAEQALKRGAHIQTEARVEDLTIPTQQGSDYVVKLSNGDEWTAPQLLLSAGRLVNQWMGQKNPRFSYVGAKAHFTGMDCSDRLIMHLLPRAYFGMAPIGDGKVNVAGLIACSHEEALRPQETFQRFLPSLAHTQLSNGRCVFKEWMTAPVPEFGVRVQPDWPNVYLLGDAAGVIPPATGNGLSMALTSGKMAAGFALQGDPKGYRKCWLDTYSPRIQKGKMLHRLFISSFVSSWIPAIGRAFPSLPEYIYRNTRSRPTS